MTRRLIAFHPMASSDDAAVAAFGRSARELFPDGRLQGGEGVIRITLEAAGVRRPVDVHLGLAWGADSGWWRPMTWVPASSGRDVFAVERALPTFVGELGLLEQDATLVLDGHYAPPGGRAGEIVDAIGLHRVAQATARLLLAQVAQQVQALATSTT